MLSNINGEVKMLKCNPTFACSFIKGHDFDIVEDGIDVFRLSITTPKGTQQVTGVFLFELSGGT